jgi:hypothetical protein
MLGLPSEESSAGLMVESNIWKTRKEVGKWRALRYP